MHVKILNLPMNKHLHLNDPFDATAGICNESIYLFDFYWDLSKCHASLSFETKQQWQILSNQVDEQQTFSLFLFLPFKNIEHFLNDVADF